ncbi:LIC12162 family protein [Candidatus Thioglobus sp.]|nr:LIC12162 family protein [Candidatus Thioglobus sp.]
MVKRTLVTSAIPELWPKDKPIVFIGEWCKRFSHKHIWEELDSYTSNYHWNDRNQLAIDFKFLDLIYEEVLKNLSDKLNSIHKTNFSKRYWRILIGPWLGIFIQVIFDRWKMLNITIDSFDIDQCNVYREDLNKFVPNDMDEFISFLLTDSWNEMIYSNILKISKNKVVLNEFEDKRRVQKRVSKNQKSIIKSYLKNSLSSVLSLFGTRDNVFIYSSSLPKTSEIKLLFKLNQFPSFWLTQAVSNFSISTNRRKWKLDVPNSNCEFRAIINKLIPKCIPRAYLEGFEVMNSDADKLPWPKKPKVIFTSTAYYTDDIFKIWSAKKVEKGSELIISQHGGNFGMTPRAFLEQHQIDICDYFLSWGWTNKNPKVIAVGNLKTTKNLHSYNPNGDAIMVEYSLPRYSYQLYSVPIASQWLDYFNEQLRLMECLPDIIRNKINVRLKGDFGWDQLSRWEDFNPNISVDIGEKPMQEDANNCRLFIATYNATTYLESLSWNIPTVIFWNVNHWELNKNTQESFDLLESVGIFHRTPESAAKQIIRIWDNIDIWWWSDKVQNARKIFCNKYSYIADDSTDKIGAIFKKSI